MLRPDVAGARTDDRQKQEKPQDMTDLHAGHRIVNSSPKGLFGHLALRVGESQASYPKADFSGRGDRGFRIVSCFLRFPTLSLIECQDCGIFTRWLHR